MGRVDGKVVLISGGARNIGGASARMLVAEGAQVVIGDLLDEEGAALAEELGDSRPLRPPRRHQRRGLGGAPSRSPSPSSAGSTCCSTTPASSTAASSSATSSELWQQMLDVNLTGAFLGIRAAADAMIAAGGGSIINTSSIEGLRGTPWAHGYVASKWGLTGLTKSVAMELAPHGIRVNSLHPGRISTPATDQMPEGLIPIPLGRPGRPRRWRRSWCSWPATSRRSRPAPSSSSTAAPSCTSPPTSDGAPRQDSNLRTSD